VVITTSPYPADARSNTNTNASRTKPFDGVYVDRDLAPLEVPVKIGDNQFESGLVFDSRTYQPLADVAPVRRGDSSAAQMQHQAVIRDFVLPEQHFSDESIRDRISLTGLLEAIAV
jgi:hypothetical protein